MAETKSKPGSKKSKAKKSPSGSASKAKSKARQSTPAASNGSGPVDGIGPLLHKAKLPLLAGGAAVAGVAGTVLATRSGGRRKLLGVSVPKRSKLSLPKKSGFKPDARKVTGAVTDAAKRVDDLGQGMSRIASSVKKVSETADEAVKKG